jgi:hypothetical protein
LAGRGRSCRWRSSTAPQHARSPVRLVPGVHGDGQETQVRRGSRLRGCHQGAGKRPQSQSQGTGRHPARRAGRDRPGPRRGCSRPCPGPAGARSGVLRLDSRERPGAGSAVRSRRETHRGHPAVHVRDAGALRTSPPVSVARQAVSAGATCPVVHVATQTGTRARQNPQHLGAQDLRGCAGVHAHIKMELTHVKSA